MIRIYLFLLAVSLGCAKKQEYEYVQTKTSEHEVLIENLDIKIVSAIAGKVNLDDDLIVDDLASSPKIDDDKRVSDASVNLSVNCQAGPSKENKKLKLKKGSYKLFQLVPLKFLTDKFNEAVKNLTCNFSFTYKKKKTKDLVPIVFSNYDYNGNLGLSKGLDRFPKSSGEVLLPEQVDDLKIDDVTESANVTVACDDFSIRDGAQILNRFRLSKYLVKGMELAKNASGLQNCRIVVEHSQPGTSVHISHRFRVLLSKPSLAISFHNLLQNFERFQNVDILGISFRNNNSYPVEVSVAGLPQQITWSPVYGYRNLETAGTVELNQTYSRKTNWFLNGQAFDGGFAQFTLGSGDTMSMSSKTKLSVRCLEGLRGAIGGHSSQFLGQLVQLESYAISVTLKYQGTTLEELVIPFEDQYPPSYFGQNRWVPFQGKVYKGRESWPGNNITRKGKEVCVP